MKKLIYLLALPLLLAFQCDDDDLSGFETSYILQNNSSVDLLLLDSADRFLELPRQSEMVIGSDLNSETSPILPSESGIFNQIQLYVLENGDYILRYNQDPINNSLWAFDEPVANQFEYRLVVTDALLN